MSVRQRFRIPVNYYRHFDADFRLDVPAEGYGGWQKKELELSFDHTALVVMHAWEFGTREQYPGWHRVVEFIPRAQEICRTVFPPLLAAVRESGMRLYHVVSSGSYAKDYPGYRRAVALAGPPPEPPEQVPSDPVREALIAFKKEYAYHGLHNIEDIKRGFKNLTFPPEALPAGDEGIAENEAQLFALCKADRINHLIYAGCAINWCLLLDSGGMAEMSRHGLMCSALRQAVTAVENKETARKELCKEIALWRVALSFGFVFDVDDFIRALRGEVRHADR
ncbi:MAG: hypothetical protein KJ964_03390 [Verrucomicrobia bacterium]|nr:hypothetical protein [Verrucomicrobiota bacterium]MBU1734342.1 hypothetical protein [Verrucomicrobiota bacterium]MBU1857974.1 hypothetical protein [Verrucomicrobiota bacterium]